MQRGWARHAARAQAGNAFIAAHEALLADAVVQTLQQQPAPIAYLDVIHPFPLPTHPITPLPGDPGGSATAVALEDR